MEGVNTKYILSGNYEIARGEHYQVFPWKTTSAKFCMHSSVFLLNE